MTPDVQAPARLSFHVKRRPLRCPRQDARLSPMRFRPPCTALALVAASRARYRTATSRSTMTGQGRAGRLRGRQMRRGREEAPGPPAWSHATVLRSAGSVPIVLPGAWTRGGKADRETLEPGRETLEPGRETLGPDRRGPSGRDRRGPNTGRGGRGRASRGMVRQYPEKGRFGPRLLRDLFPPGGQRRVRSALLSRVHTPAR